VGGGGGDLITQGSQLQRWLCPNWLQVLSGTIGGGLLRMLGIELTPSLNVT
jgi:hypothetical protein